MKTSYLLFMTFLTNRIKALQQRRKKYVDFKEDYVKKINLKNQHKSILIGL